MMLATSPLYFAKPSTPSGTYFEISFCFDLKYLSAEPLFIAPTEPIPLKLLKYLPFLLISFPGASSVPANNEPIITASAPAAKALAKSPEYLIPPSAMILTFLFLIPFLTERIALNCGTPIPATNLVVQIDPGPIPTLIISTPKFNKYFAASGVAMFPAHNAVFLVLIFLINLTISETFLVCP